MSKTYKIESLAKELAKDWRNMNLTNEDKQPEPAAAGIFRQLQSTIRRT